MLTDMRYSRSGSWSGAFGPEPAFNAAPPQNRLRAAAAGDLPAPLEAREREHILDVLRQVNGNRMAAAKLLGISRRALYRRLERHQIADEAPPPGSRRG